MGYLASTTAQEYVGKFVVYLLTCLDKCILWHGARSHGWFMTPQCGFRLLDRILVATWASQDRCEFEDNMWTIHLECSTLN